MSLKKYEQHERWNYEVPEILRTQAYIVVQNTEGNFPHHIHHWDVTQITRVGTITQPQARAIYPLVNEQVAHGVLAPSNSWRGFVRPAKCGTSAERISNDEVRSTVEHHATITWAQRLKRVFNIELCGHCGRSVKVIACIEDRDIINKILAHLRQQEQGSPTLSHLVPHSRAPPEPLPLFARTKSTAPNQQGRC